MATDFLSGLGNPDTSFLSSIEETHKNISHGHVTKIVSYLMSKYDIRYIHIIGETPEFNDGEPCEHTGHTAIKYDGKYIGSELEDILNVDIENMHLTGQRVSDPYYINSTSLDLSETLAEPWSPEVKALTEALWAMQFKFHDEYGTNNARLFQREADGSVIIYWARCESDY